MQTNRSEQHIKISAILKQNCGSLFSNITELKYFSTAILQVDIKVSYSILLSFHAIFCSSNTPSISSYINLDSFVNYIDTTKLNNNPSN